MQTGLDNVARENRSQAAPRHSSHYKKKQFLSWPTLFSLIALTLAALIPRVILATQLDVVTDEPVYIRGGKYYLPLLQHLQINAPLWSYNYEHPPLVKLLIGLALKLNTKLGQPLSELMATRLPSILLGSAMVVAIYWLGRRPFGRVVALLAALCLAFSPWLVFFSSLAYLDTTMTALITVAYLLLWYAPRRPWLYALCALLVGLGAASKYTAVLAIPGIVLFTAYYFFLLRPRLPQDERPPIPWRWWLAALVLAPLAFLLADPAIWPDPYHLLIHSFRYEWDHSVNGHLTFIAGHYAYHVPHWSILYIAITKLSAFVTIPAALFLVLALIQLFRFHLRPSHAQTSAQTTQMAGRAFLVIWLLAILGMFSLLNIVVGTHYHLPIATPIALAGASGLALLLRYRRGQLLSTHKATLTRFASSLPQPRFHTAIVVTLLALALVGPHLLGLLTTPGAEGYTSEFFHGENSALQVAYPDYRGALSWLAQHTHGRPSVGLVAIPETLGMGWLDSTWYYYNQNFTHTFSLQEAHPTDKQFAQFDYLIWPMHLLQRGYALPEPWRSHIIHMQMGGETTYCYIMTRT